MILGYVISIVLTAALSGFLAWYAWRQRAVPGARAYARLALAGCLLALLETLSALSPSPDLALFWFRLCFTAGALTAVFWFTFALEYSGWTEWLSGRVVAGLFVIPALTQVLLWSNALHGLWVRQEAVFYRSGPFWIADIAARIPGLGLLTHLFYALFLVLAGVALIFLTAWRIRRAWRGQALALAGAGFIAFIFVANTLFPILPKTDFDPFTPGMGVSVLLIALAVFRFQFLKRAPETTPLPGQTRWQASERRALAFFLLVFLLLISGLSTGAYLHYTGYKRHFRAQVDDQLAAITDLKVNGLQDWRAEQLGDAEVLRRSPAFSTLVQDYFQDPTATQAADMLQAWLDSLRVAYGYERVFLLDTGGVERLASPSIPAPVAGHLVEDAAAVLESGQVTFLDFHRDAAEEPIYLALLAPVYAEGDIDRPLGVVVLRIDPYRTLYPYLQQWPTPSETAETLLIRREGDTVLFLNELRFQQDAALTLRYSLAETDILAVKAALGQRGPVEGQDYRGHPVVGHLRAAPDSPWLLVARMDKAEVYAPLQERLWQTLLVLGILTLACGAGLVNVWRQQQIRHYRGRAAVLDALRESEERYRLLAETTRDIILLHDMEGRITYVNRAGLDFGGFDEVEALGKPITAFVPPDRLAEIVERRARRAIGNETTFLYETEFVDNAGRRIPVEVNSTPIQREGKPAQMLIVARDVTERKQTEDALREALTQANQSHRALLGVLEDQKEIEAALARTERIYRQAITQAGGVPYQRDYNSDNYAFLGEGIEKLTGYTAAELTGPLFTSRLRQVEAYGDYKDLPHAERIRLSRQGVIKEWREDNLFERKDGSLVWLADHSVPVYDESGNIAGALGILLDITEDKRREAELQRLLVEAERAHLALLSVVEDQKRAEAALAAERTLLRTLVDHLPIAVYVKDVAGRKTLANPVDVHNTGANSEADILGKTDFELFPPDLAASYHADDMVVIESGQPVLNREEMITHPGGDRGWQSTSKVPVHDSAGEIVGLVGIGYDITERKQAAMVLQQYTQQLEAMVAERTRALEEAQERLLRQTRLATLGQIAGSIAHELRTPLGAIKNAAYLINMLQGASGETLEEALDILNQEVANSDRIITSLLNFARPQRPRQQLLEVGPLVERAARHLQPPPEVQVEAHVDGALSPVIADATHLEQALGNLLLNALQAMPEGGRLTVCAEQRASLPDIEPPGFLPEHAADANAGWIAVSVGDTGVGISPENLEHVFEPLFTTKTTGIGLGLALVRLLVQANGGGIAVSSAPGEGTTFDIYLPVAGMSDENIK